ncbi:MAG: hypothetical protein JW849_09365 [Phycisphaerae bacterium]|nr:hypothetical protein [Phycisphaerae bacterium]
MNDDTTGDSQALKDFGRVPDGISVIRSKDFPARKQLSRSPRRYSSSDSNETTDPPSNPPDWFCGCHACRYRLAQERQKPCWFKNQQARAKKRGHPLGIHCESGHWEV